MLLLLLLLLAVGRAAKPSYNASDLHFMHIPKTGGTSIEEAGRDAGFFWGRYDSGWRRRRGRKRHACNPWHAPQGVERAPSFCVLREPGARLAAQYRHEVDAEAYCDVGAFETWAASALRRARRIDGYGDCHFLQQTDYARYCDHALRFSRVADDLAAVLACYGFDASKLAVARLGGGERQTEKRAGYRSDCGEALAAAARAAPGFELYADDVRLWADRVSDGPPKCSGHRYTRRFRPWPDPPPLRTCDQVGEGALVDPAPGVAAFWADFRAQGEAENAKLALPTNRTRSRASGTLGRRRVALVLDGAGDEVACKRDSPPRQVHEAAQKRGAGARVWPKARRRRPKDGGSLDTPD